MKIPKIFWLCGGGLIEKYNEFPKKNEKMDNEKIPLPRLGMAGVLVTEPDNVDIEVAKRIEDEDKGTYFDDAITLCGYGRFHIYLFIASIFGQIACTMVASVSAYLLANAECDLSMTLANKGTLNAIPYAGMVSSGLLTGFLSDALGRKIILVWGFLLMGVCLLIQAVCQSFEMLLTMKFLEGFCFTGPFTVIVAYLGEMHDDKIRSKIIMFSFCFIGVSNIILPQSGWALLPYDWAFVIIKDHLVIRSWHIFLALNSIWAFIAWVMFQYLPESPKFELTHSKHDKALKTLQEMYASNTGMPPETYPVKRVYLNMTFEATSSSLWGTIKRGLNIMKPLFSRKYVLKLSHVCFMQFCIMFSFNTFRLWYPQLATIFENYGKSHDEFAPLCVMLDGYLEERAHAAANLTQIVECVAVRSGKETYINSTILGAMTILPFLVAGFVIAKLGKKILIFITMSTCGILAATLYLSINSFMIVSYFAIFIPLAQTTVTLVLTVTVDAFPTAYRAFAVSSTMVSGRIGALIGNIFFPYFLEIGCLVPFFIVASLCFTAAFLALVIQNKMDETK